jgi:hypothetical protein
MMSPTDDMEMSAMRTLRATTTITIASIIGCALSTSPLVHAASPAQRNIDDNRIVVTDVAGTVTVSSLGVPSRVHVDSTLALPSRIVTGSDGSLGLRQAHTSISIAPDSEIAIPQEAADGNLIARLVQYRGNAFYDVAPREVSKLRVETPFLVAVIKGTQFNVAVQQDSTTISLFEGRLEIRTPDDSEVIQLNAGEIAIRSRNDGAIRVIGMNDDRLAAPRAATEPIAGDDAGLAAMVDVDASSADTRFDANVDLGAPNAGLTLAAGADLGVGSVDLGLDAGADLGMGSADLALDAGADLGAGSVDLGLDVGADLGAGSVDLGLDVGADLGAGSLDLGLDTGVDLDAGTLDVGLDTGVDLGGATADLGLDTTLDVGGGSLDVGLDAGLDLGAGGTDIGIDVGLDQGLDVDVTVGDTGLDVGIDLGGDEPVIDVLPSPPEGGGGLGGLLGRIL